MFVVGMELMEPSWVQIGLEDYNPTRLEYQVVDYHKNARKHFLELRVLDFIVCHSIANNGWKCIYVGGLQCIYAKWSTLIREIYIVTEMSSKILPKKCYD